MSGAPEHEKDPLGWSVLLTLAFMALCAVRLTTPSAIYFDEIHYVAAANAMFDSLDYPNREHPLLGKQLIALGIALFGNEALGWRIMPWLFGGLTLFASMRALWFASERRFATLAYGFLLASGFLVFIHARIAMLDIFMLGFLALAFWQLAAAMREPERGRWRLVLAGVALGCAMASKWNAIPIAMIPGLAFLALRFGAGRRRLLTSQRGGPVPGVSLLEAAVWLGALPLAVYALSFWQGYLIANGPLVQEGLVGLHKQMFEMQSNLRDEHPYQSQWWQWMLNVHGIWYLYEPADGAQRGVLLIGNPLTMLLGLGALVWVGWAGIFKGRNDAFAVFLLYLASIGFWIIAAKPVQFYYHYLLPSCFLLAALALALDALWQRGWRWPVMLLLASSATMFAYFYPILSAAPLGSDDAFLQWTWLDSWR